MEVSLASLLDSLMKLAERDAAYRDDQHMSKVFAANPEFGSRLYGARNDAAQNQRAMRAMALEEQEIARKQRQREALASLAQTVGGNPNINPVDALVQFAGVTGDVDPLSDLFVAREKARSGIDSPAAVKLANEIERARKEENFVRINDLLLSGKLLDKGVVLGEDGAADVMEGYPSVLTTLEEAKQTGTNLSDLSYKPRIAGEEAGAKLEQELGYAPRIEEEKKKASSKAERESELNERIATLPQLEKTVKELSDLGKRATYTKMGQLRDVIVKESGRGTTDGAVARAEYIALIDNQILPLLRQTFGAAFTQKEGESLKATLGDPNMSPEEKDAVLRQFIDQKKQVIESMKRQGGQSAAPLSVDDLGLTEMSDEDILRALGGP